MTNNAWNTPDLTGNGKLLIGQTGGRPVVANLTPCAFDITNGSNSITIDTIATGSDYDKISASTASDSATIDFTGLSSTYFVYKIEITDLIPETDGTLLYMRTSTDNGSNFDAGSTDYRWCHVGVDNNASIKDEGSSGTTQMQIIGRTNDPIGNAANETCSATVFLYNPTDTAWTKVFCKSEFVRTNGDCWLMMAGGMRESTTAVDAIRFLMDSDNITSGTFTLYGLKA